MKPLYLFVGKSSSGKTTISEILEAQHGLKTLQSYTTRPKRYENETGHTFITDAEFDKLQNIVAYTEYDNHRYCATKEQIDDTDIYVIDIPGVETLLDAYDTERPIVIMYFDADVVTRIHRMINRGDSDNKIVGRLIQDEADNWSKQLADIYMVNHHRVSLRTINAGKDKDEVLEKVLFNIKHLEDKNN